MNTIPNTLAMQSEYPSSQPIQEVEPQESTARLFGTEWSMQKKQSARIQNAVKITQLFAL